MDEQPAVLVVDDDAVTRTVVRSGLTRLGLYRVLEASDGAKAQEILLNDSVDVVVTDLQMPGLSGLDLIRWANDNDRAPMWIILSGMETFDAAVDAIQVGAFDFLGKPPGMQELEVSVRRAIEHKQLLEERDRLFAALEAETAVIHRDLERAEVIQRALLPSKPPQLDNYNVNALYSPGQHVGGDLYNVIRIGPRHLVIYVADATGHGVSSAMLSVLFNRRLIIRDEKGGPLPPAVVLERVNRSIEAEHVGAGLFLTAAYCVIDLEARALRFAAAGHPPVVWRKNSGEIEKLTRTGPVLGITADARYSEVAVQIGEQDRFLFFTDGLMQYDEAAQWAAVEETLQAQEAGSVLLQRLMASAHHSGEDRDDMTLLLLEAAQGTSQFNNVAGSTSSFGSVIKPTCAWYGERDKEAFLQIRGRGTWQDCDAFYDTAQALADDLKPVVIDLSACDYLDSTFLGTVHELVTGSKVRLQSLTPSVRATFEEMDMSDVLRAADQPATPLPEELTPLSSVAAAGSASQKRILRAHETLSELSDRNKSKFAGVVEAMRSSES